MVYKKYIKKDGKLYGPYYYHSRRVDGKVISEYHGIKKIEHGKFLKMFLAAVLVVVLIYGVITFTGNGLTGRVVMDIGANYEEGQSLSGNLRVLLKEGELLPASSRLVFETPQQKYEYSLDQIISEQQVEGHFYVAGKSLIGTGFGYGEEGLGEFYPVVRFTLNLLSTISEENQTQNQTAGAGITGNVISGFFSKLNPTGNVILEVENIVEGEISVGNDFILELSEGGSVELVPGSVRTETTDLPDNAVEVAMSGTTVFVTTDYSEIEYGFGEKYLGDYDKIFDIDLSTLDLGLDPGELSIRLVYGEENIISVSTTLGNGSIVVQEQIVEEQAIDQIPTQIPLEPTTSNKAKTFTQTQAPRVSGILTVEERGTLVSEFGNFSVQVTRAETKKQRTIIRYELGNYWYEATYDVSLSLEELELQMELDKNKWLKDIARKLLEKEPVTQEIEELLGNYSI